MCISFVFHVLYLYVNCPLSQLTSEVASANNLDSIWGANDNLFSSVEVNPIESVS